MSAREIVQQKDITKNQTQYITVMMYINFKLLILNIKVKDFDKERNGLNLINWVSDYKCRYIKAM